MATCEKTVVFAFPSFASISDATVTNIDQISLYIPEASPTFISVYAEVGFQDGITATGGTIGEHRVALRLGAAGYTTITETDDITNSGENMSGVIGPFDFTSHFNTNWSGTSMTCDCRLYFDHTTGSTQVMRNLTVMVYVTYTYDDAAATQIKTVRIPLDSSPAPLPTVASNYGTNQIPQLTSGGVLPEAGVVIRDWFMVIEGNEINTSNVDFTLNANIDGGTTFSFAVQECALQSDRFCRWVYKPAVPDPTSAHNLQMWTSITGHLHHATVTLYVTYEFTLSGTSRVLNSLLIPIEIASPLGVTTSAEASRFQRDIMVVEPGTVSLKQSAFRVNYNCAATPSTINFRAGAQAYTSYTTGGAVVVGMFSVQRRIDSGAVGGAGFTLARGRNTLTIDGYSTNVNNQMTNLSGHVILNYESDLSAEGVGAHAHTIFKVLLPWDAALTDRVRVTGYSVPIPESQYWLVATGFCFIQWVQSAANAVTFDVEALPGEGKGAGYYDIYADAYQADNERNCTIVWMRGRDTFKRYPEDADPDRLDIEVARDYRLFTSATCGNGIMATLTYHTMTWEAAGNITGNDAALPTTVKLVNADTHEVMQEQVLTAGTTAFSFTVYDNTEFYYIDAYQDATHLGRSALAQAA